MTKDPSGRLQVTKHCACRQRLRSAQQDTGRVRVRVEPMMTAAGQTTMVSVGHQLGVHQPNRCAILIGFVPAD